MLYQFILVIHTLIALSIIVLVFLQHGKGADIGAAFGSGASNTVFGSSGSGGVLYKATGMFAFAFCVTSITLTAILAKDRNQALNIRVPSANTEISAPVVPVTKNSEVPVVEETTNQNTNPTTTTSSNATK